MKLKKFKTHFAIHYSFIIIMVVGTLCGMGLLLLMYFLCLVLHEVVHGIVAKKLGYSIGKIKLLATGAVLEAESDEFSLNDEILIAVSGPLFNLAFAIFLFALWWIFPLTYNYTQDLCVINLAIFGFNILPIFPLDGGRILLALLSKRCERCNAVKITKIITFIFATILFIVFIISLFFKPNFSFGTASITLFISGFSKDKDAVYKRTLYMSRKLERVKTRGIENRYIYVNQNMDKLKMFRLVDAKHFTCFVLVDNNLNPVKVIRENELFDNF